MFRIWIIATGYRTYRMTHEQLMIVLELRPLQPTESIIYEG